MSLCSLQVLADKRNDILLAEVGALLHDVGKFCDLHIEAEGIGGTRKWSNAHAYKAVMDNPTEVIRLSKTVANRPKPDVINHVLNASSPKIADFLLPTFKDALKQTRVILQGESYTLAELVMFSTPGFAVHPSRSILFDGMDGWLPAALGVCHHEAHHDKQEPGDKTGQQLFASTFISTPFGDEKEIVIINDPQKGLDARLKSLPVTVASLGKPRVVGNKILKEFEYGLGDTRHSINEVTLADWAWTVAALFKPVLAFVTLQSIKPSIRQWSSWKDKILDHDLRWRLLRINFDALGLYARAIKIADLLGYKDRIDQACAAVKQLVEEEYPLGNEVYRDTTGIYFTFPDLDLPAELAQEIRRRVEEIEMELAPCIEVGQASGTTATEQLKKLLAEQRDQAHEELTYPIVPENLNPCWQAQWENLPEGKWGLCPVCRLRPMREKREACEHCEGRRQSRIELWERDPSKTIWLDEIADHKHRVALIVGKFGLDDWLSGDMVQTLLVKAVENDDKACVPKNPSPARLRRVWETTQRLWTETVEKEILANHEYAEGMKNIELRCARLLVIPDKKHGWKENVPYDGSLNGQAVSLLWRDDAKYFVTISNLQLAAGDATDVNELAGKWKGQQIVVSDPDNPRQQIRFIVQSAMRAMGEMGAYVPYLSLLSSPDQFLTLVPASDALDLTSRIHDEYQKQFGKVQNRLPLFLGLVFFQRKTPLIAVMDTARRMLEQVKLGEEPWKIRDGMANGQVQFENGITWTVPTKMGDGTEDVWYPYFFEGDTGTRSRCFQLNDRWLVHVSDLHAGDAVCVMPSRFAYIYLEHTAQRFRFDPNRDVMLLDELPRLVEMWEDICDAPDMSDTKLQAIGALFESKWQLWRLDEKDGDVEARRRTFRDLVETTFKRDGVKISPDKALNGNFQRCLDLYLHILKRRVKEEKHEQQR